MAEENNIYPLPEEAWLGTAHRLNHYLVGEHCAQLSKAQPLPAEEDPTLDDDSPSSI